ncbi:MAG: filamentous hemagglutinin N-terminal domain-containing protein, partial [Planctomycetota bacterium]|nr:filamentous hemagglutinin N-terminal domain-containing protein [Planctomycetota bacterium]
MAQMRLARLGAWVAAAMLLAATTQCLLAEPQGAQVIQGDVSLQTNGDYTTIHAGNNSIIHYNQFDIAPRETVQFIQPSASSRVLNRILGGYPSQIQGSLLANGIVYLVNPAGVIFGQGAFVDVGGLYAAAADISNRDFLSGADVFRNIQGPVLNYGNIRGQSVHLVGRQVANYGNIVAEDGLLAMVAGDEVHIGQFGARVSVTVPASAGGPADGAAVENAGTADAGRGELLIAAGDLYSLAFRNTGLLKAAGVTIDGHGGDVQVAGTIDASDASPGATGGRVEILGGRIALRHATIDASGDAGGGTVRIGGDFQGLGGLPTASLTYVDGDSSISADALAVGDGGNIVIWSDGVTYYYGHLSARAGGGSGGFAEVSSGGRLVFLGTVDLSAPVGTGGNLLLDPDTITIVAGATPGAGDINGDTTFGDDIANLTDLDDAALDYTNLDSIITNAGVNALLTGANTLTLAAEETITVDGAVTGADTASLTLEAPAIGLNQTITLGGTLTCDGAVTLGADVTLTGGTVTFNGTVDDGAGGPWDLTINSPTTGFHGRVGNGQALDVLQTDAAGTTTIDTDVVKGATLDFNDDVATTAASALTGTTLVDFAKTLTIGDAAAEALTVAGTTANFNGTVNSGATFANDLTVNATTTLLAGQVGNAANGALGQLETDAAGTTRINGGVVTTTGNQTYNDAVELGANTTLTGTDVSFLGTLDADATGNDRTLLVNASGVTTFGNGAADAVGGTGRLETLTTDAAGRTEIGTTTMNLDGASVTFNDPVLLTADLTIDEAGPGDVTFASTVDSADGANYTLTVNTPGGGNTIFGGAVGSDALVALSQDDGLGAVATDALGTTGINGGVVTTTGNQTYGDPVQLGANTVLTAGGGVTFNARLDSDALATPRDLTVNATGNATFAAPVGYGANGAYDNQLGDDRPLRDLTVNAAGLFLHEVSTTGDQVYSVGGDIELQSKDYDAGGKIEFNTNRA